MQHQCLSPVFLWFFQRANLLCIFPGAHIAPSGGEAPLPTAYHHCSILLSQKWWLAIREVDGGKKQQQPHEDAGVCFRRLFAFALLSFKLQFSAANTPSHHMCEGMERWRRGGAASVDSAPLCASKMSLIISIYHPQTSENPTEPSSPCTPHSARIIPTPPSPISAVKHCV